MVELDWHRNWFCLKSGEDFSVHYKPVWSVGLTLGPREKGSECGECWGASILGFGGVCTPAAVPRVGFSPDLSTNSF